MNDITKLKYIQSLLNWEDNDNYINLYLIRVIFRHYKCSGELPSPEEFSNKGEQDKFQLITRQIVIKSTIFSKSIVELICYMCYVAIDIIINLLEFNSYHMSKLCENVIMKLIVIPVGIFLKNNKNELFDNLRIVGNYVGLKYYWSEDMKLLEKLIRQTFDDEHILF